MANRAAESHDSGSDEGYRRDPLTEAIRAQDEVEEFEMIAGTIEDLEERMRRCRDIDL